MAGDSAEEAGVFILHFALDDAMTEGAVVGGRGNGDLPGGRRIEKRVRHAEGAEDFTLAEAVERFVGDAFQSDAENDEADVAVLSAGAGIGGERGSECCGQEFSASFGAKEQFFVRREARGVSQQHPEGDVAAVGVCSGEFGNDGSDGRFEIEQATLVEEHGHAGSGDNFGDGGQVEDGVRRYMGGVGFVGEMAESFQRD